MHLDVLGSWLRKISLPAQLAKIILLNELSLGRKKSFNASDDIENEEISRELSSLAPPLYSSPILCKRHTDTLHLLSPHLKTVTSSCWRCRE